MLWKSNWKCFIYHSYFDWSTNKKRKYVVESCWTFGLNTKQNVLTLESNSQQSWVVAQHGTLSIKISNGRRQYLSPRLLQFINEALRVENQFRCASVCTGKSERAKIILTQDYMLLSTKKCFAKMFSVDALYVRKRIN